MQVIIMGAGIQGVCAALALARKGWSVLLVDQEPDCMLRASARGEGKIHLGHVYAHDASMKTSYLMLRSALHFAPLIDAWLGRPVDWTSLTSRPFTYVVAGESLLSPADLMAHYDRIERAYLEMADGSRLHYLGQRPSRLWQDVRAPPELGGETTKTAVSTPELAVDIQELRSILRSAVGASERIESVFRHRVESVSRTPRGFRVEGVDHGRGVWAREADAVVNCLWEGRLAIDQEMGLVPDRRWVYRLKYRVLARLPSRLGLLPSLTFVLGPFGDVVTYPTGAETYLSWYPTCMRGWCTDLSPPRTWNAACNGQLDPADREAIAQSTLESFDRLVPGVADSAVTAVDAGIIFAWGDCDIDRPESELHQRHDTGVHPADGYFSINTGKLTCAPLFAHELSELV